MSSSPSTPADILILGQPYGQQATDYGTVAHHNPLSPAELSVEQALE